MYIYITRINGVVETDTNKKAASSRRSQAVRVGAEVVDFGAREFKIAPAKDCEGNKGFAVAYYDAVAKCWVGPYPMLYGSRKIAVQCLRDSLRNAL
jgi:hypothetical protein